MATKKKRVSIGRQIMAAFEAGDWLTDSGAKERFGTMRFRNYMSEWRKKGILFYQEWIRDSAGRRICMRYRLIKRGA